MGILFTNDAEIVFNRIREEKNLVVLYFFVEDSAECNQMSDVINEVDLNAEHKSVTFIKINAAKADALSKEYQVESAPTFMFFLSGVVVDRLVGANVPLFSKKIEEHKNKLTDKSLNEKLEKLIKKAPVMLFMKGNPSAPRCGFSKQVTALLDSHNAKYETFDILEDPSVREGLKKYSNWPTYPQLYINGDLIGGLDILKELSANGELDDLLKAAL